MRSLSRLVRVAVITALLTALAAGTASAARVESAPVVRVELDLPASNGLRAHLERRRTRTSRSNSGARPTEPFSGSSTKSPVK